jgi:hypothetical protein
LLELNKKKIKFENVIRYKLKRIMGAGIGFTFDVDYRKFKLVGVSILIA